MADYLRLRPGETSAEADAVRNDAVPSRNDAADGLAGRCPARPILIVKTQPGRTKLNAVTCAKRARLAALLSLLAVGTASAADGDRGLVEQVRAANDRLKDVAVALAEGYGPIPCASGTDGGAMGVHYVKASLIGESVDLKAPQAIMYEPAADGKMELIAVEYITTKGPASIGGQLFSFTGAPNRYGLGPFYELHVWAWKANQRGAFADMNPAVSCEHAH